MAENPLPESQIELTPIGSKEVFLEPNQETSLSQIHAHHWIIETPDGHLHSKGICKHCGQENMFKNWLEETDFTTSSEREFNA